MAPDQQGHVLGIAVQDVDVHPPACLGRLGDRVDAHLAEKLFHEVRNGVRLLLDVHVLVSPVSCGHPGDPPVPGFFFLGLSWLPGLAPLGGLPPGAGRFWGGFFGALLGAAGLRGRLLHDLLLVNGRLGLLVHPAHDALLLGGALGHLFALLGHAPLERLGSDMPCAQHQVCWEIWIALAVVQYMIGPRRERHPHTPYIRGMYFMIACCEPDCALGGLALVIWRCW